MPQKTPHRFPFLKNPAKQWDAEAVYRYYAAGNGVRYFPILDEAEAARQKVDSIMENRFCFNHETHLLAPGFDWTVNPSEDLEWHILLHKFYYAVGMGKAFHETGDRRYLDKWVELISGWMEAVPPGFIAADVTGRRVQNWISSHYYFVTHNRRIPLRPQFYARFLTSVYEQVAYLCENLTARRNHRTLELWAIFLAAVVFPEMEPAAEWRRFSLEELYRNMQEDLLPDGVQCELSTDYHHIVLRNYLAARRLAAANHLAVPPGMDALLKKALEFALYSHKPDGAIPSLSDGDCGSFLSLLREGYQLYRQPELLFAASAGRRGRAPSARSKAFPAAGYYVLRSGWGEGRRSYAGEKYLIFDCGPLGAGNHGHLDLLSFEMAAGGRSLIVDPGRYTYHEKGPVNWRARFRGTAYHNTVQVDGKNQAAYQYHPRKKKFAIVGPHARHHLHAFVSGEDFDFLHGSAAGAEYDAFHERMIFFLCPEYWIISDILTAEKRHRYDLHFHLSPAALDKVEISTRDKTQQILSPQLLMARAFAENVDTEVISGFVSPAYGIKQRAPVLRMTCRADCCAFHTVLYPFERTAPAIAVEELVFPNHQALSKGPRRTGLKITICHENQVFYDYFFAVSAGDYRQPLAGATDPAASFFFARLSQSGEVLRLHSPKSTGKIRRAAAGRRAAKRRTVDAHHGTILTLNQET